MSAGAKKLQASKTKYGLWVEGSSTTGGHSEPGPHESLGIGDPNGKNYTFSFGHESGSMFGGEGAVYLDTTKGGAIKEYYSLTDAQAVEMLDTLATSIETKGTYNLITNNCRHYTHDTLNALVKQYGLTQSLTPYRASTPSGGYPGGSTGRGLMDASVFTASP